MKKFGMENCENFIRGTIRFSGFSFIISVFHDMGLTSDDLVPSHVRTLRELASSKLARASKLLNPYALRAVKEPLDNMSNEDKDYTLRLMSDIDISYIKP